MAKPTVKAVQCGEAGELVEGDGTKGAASPAVNLRFTGQTSQGRRDLAPNTTFSPERIFIWNNYTRYVFSIVEGYRIMARIIRPTVDPWRVRGGGVNDLHATDRLEHQRETLRNGEMRLENSFDQIFIEACSKPDPQLILENDRPSGPEEWTSSHEKQPRSRRSLIGNDHHHHCSAEKATIWPERFLGAVVCTDEARIGATARVRFDAGIQWAAVAGPLSGS